MPSHAVVGKQGVQEGTKHAPLRGLMLRVSVVDVLLTWGWPVKKSRIQLQRETFSPRVLG